MEPTPPTTEDAKKMADLEGGDPEKSQDAAEYFWENSIPDAYLPRVEKAFWEQLDPYTRSGIIRAMGSANHAGSIDILIRIHEQCRDSELVEESYDMLRQMFCDWPEMLEIVPAHIKESLIMDTM